MTIEQCHETLSSIRRRQGTPSPVVRVDYNGAAYSGRISRSDSDPDRRRSHDAPFGLLVLEEAGLAPGPETILQIASIPPGGIRDVREN